jgi:hypothetical protein
MSADYRFKARDNFAEYIDELSNKTGMSKSDVIQSIVFHYQTGKKLMPFPAELKVKYEISSALNKYGNNLNQIAHKVNSHALNHTINERLLEDLLKALQNIENKIENIVEKL